MDALHCPSCHADLDVPDAAGWAFVYSSALLHLDGCDNRCSPDQRRMCAEAIADAVVSWPGMEGCTMAYEPLPATPAAGRKSFIDVGRVYARH